VELVLGEAKGGARTASVRQVVHAEGTKFHQAHQASMLLHNPCTLKLAHQASTIKYLEPGTGHALGTFVLALPAN
jgi:hypothetical protein